MQSYRSNQISTAVLADRALRNASITKRPAHHLGNERPVFAMREDMWLAAGPQELPMN